MSRTATRKRTASDEATENEARHTEPATNESVELDESDTVADVLADEESADETTETTEELVSPYKAAQLIKEWYDVELPPQMLYTYVKNGRLKADENKKITHTDLREWAEKLIDGRKRRAEAKKAAAEAELNGGTTPTEVTEAE